MCRRISDVFPTPATGGGMKTGARLSMHSAGVEKAKEAGPMACGHTWLPCHHDRERPAVIDGCRGGAPHRPRHGG